MFKRFSEYIKNILKPKRRSLAFNVGRALWGSLSLLLPAEREGLIDPGRPDLRTGCHSQPKSRLFLAKRPWELWRVNTGPGLRPVNILLPPPPPPLALALRAQPMSEHYGPRYSPHQFHFQS